MYFRCVLASVLIGVCTISCSMVFSADPQRIEPSEETGSSLAVIVGEQPLVHTEQILPLDPQGHVLSAGNAAAQTAAVLDRAANAVTSAGGATDQLIKLNVYMARLDDAPAVSKAIRERFQRGGQPATSYVVTPLSVPGALVAMDAVAAVRAGQLVETVVMKQGSAILPSGSRIYVAGQAEKGASLAEATTKTLESLRQTLKFLGRQDSDIVQLKSFLSPMSNVAEAKQAMATFFGDHPVPPSVWVEWTSPLIEIELIAWGGTKKEGPVVEFLTPPGMTASPVYCRVARTNSDRMIYFSGLFARQPTDAAGEVVDIFEQLGSALRASGSDLRHLVKATYYCSTNDTSVKLNELRPKYYDPARPPSASKAMVRSVGRTERGLTIDMIAVPTSR